MKKIEVIVVEDHKLVREMWIRSLAANSDMEVVGESGLFDEAIEMIKDKRPDIVLLDINLPPASGFDAVPLIREYSPNTKIIIVSMHNQPSYCKKMLGLGAMGYVTKNSSQKELFKAIEEVMQGKTFVCNEIKDILLNLEMADEPSGIKELTSREIEIIKLLKEGLTSKEIAVKFNRSFKTVEVHRHNILKKLKLNNTASLIQFVNSTNLSFS
ncbi:MAG: two component transcriptional regulator, LuxR family [Chitinophagaceae bacterium]|nr:two component transcriptional regulator, LuxR family [Chitinophagaceae bacterium]